MRASSASRITLWPRRIRMTGSIGSAMTNPSVRLRVLFISLKRRSSFSPPPRQTETREIDLHSIRNDLIELADERDCRRQHSLQNDSDDRRVRARIDARDLLEKEFVVGHRKIYARRG